jgi:hypothetical protein
MFDNLRDLSEGRAPVQQPEPPMPTEDYQPTGSGRFLGMTAAQRLVIAMLLFFAVVFLGSLCLLVTERVFIV